jgi:hypothetical protein
MKNIPSKTYPRIRERTNLKQLRSIYLVRTLTLKVTIAWRKIDALAKKKGVAEG